MAGVRTCKGGDGPDGGRRARVRGGAYIPWSLSSLLNLLWKVRQWLPLCKCSAGPLLLLDNKCQCQSCLGTLGTYKKYGLLDPLWVSPESIEWAWHLQGNMLLSGGLCTHPNYFYFLQYLKKITWWGQWEELGKRDGLHHFFLHLFSPTPPTLPGEFFFFS